MAERLSREEREKLRQVAVSIRHSGSSEVSKIIAMAIYQLLDDLQAAEERAERLREGLSEGLDTATEGWAYASDYFREKWGAVEKLNRMLRALQDDERMGA